MLKRLSPRERFEQLVSTYEPAVRLAFLDAIDIVLRRVIERLERGDINGAVAAMHLDPAAFRPLDESIRQAFNGGGVATVEQMRALKDSEGNRVVVRFDRSRVLQQALSAAPEEWRSAEVEDQFVSRPASPARSTAATGGLAIMAFANLTISGG